MSRRARTALRSLSDLVFVVAGIAIPAIAFADGPSPECSPTPTTPLPEIHAFVSAGIAPLKDAYLNLNRFEADPLTSDLAAIENETDPPRKRKTFSFLVRGSSAEQTYARMRWTTLTDENSPYHVAWSNGSAEIWNVAAYQKNAQLGMALPAVSMIDLGELQEMSVDQIEDRLKSTFSRTDADLKSTGGPFAGASDFRMMASYLKLTAVKDEADYRNTTASLAKNLSWAEKARLIQVTGADAGSHYDYARAGKENPKNADGTANPGLSFRYGKSIPSLAVLQNLRTRNRLGICRDIAPMQARLMKDFGFRNVYSIGFDEGVNHAAVIAQNPDDPKQILLLNYGGLETGDLRQGMASLTRGQDYSTRYQIYTPEGKEVANLPSELGTLLVEGEGGNLKTMDPFLYRPSGSISRLSLDGKHSQFPIFVGRTSAGDRVVGIGNTFHYGDPNRNIVSVTNTAGLAYQSKNAAVYSDRTQTFDALHANLTTAVSVNSHWKEWTTPSKGTLSAQATTTTVLHGDVAVAGVGNYLRNGPSYADRKKQYDADLARWKIDAERAARSGAAPPPIPAAPARPALSLGGSSAATTEVGVNAKFVSADEKTKIDGRLANQFSLGGKDLSAGDVDRVYTNLTYFTLSGERVVLPERLALTLSTAVGLREFGPQILIQGGASLPQSGIKASAGYQGALKKDALTIAPGTEREFIADFEKSFKNSLVLTASYQQPLGMSVGVGQVGAKASLSELLKRKKRKSR